MNQSKRITLASHVRMVIGDPDGEIFTDGELDALIKGRYVTFTENDTITYYEGAFYSMLPCPVYNMTITSGTSGDYYLIDENSKTVTWQSGSVSPSNSNTLTIKYINIDFCALISDLLFIIATDKAKLAIKASIEGSGEDLSILRKELMAQRGAWLREKSWGGT